MAFWSCGPNSVAAQIPAPTPAIVTMDLPTGEKDVEIAWPGSLTVVETNGNKCREIVSVWGSLFISTYSLSPI